MADGHIDYRKYALPDLREALEGIDKERYPINLANLQAEIVRREALGEPDIHTNPISAEKYGRSSLALVFFGVCWFLFFWIVVGGLFASVASTLALKGEGRSFKEAYAAGRDYGEAWGREYGGYFFYGGLAVSVLGTATGVLPGARRRRRAQEAQQSVAADRREDAAPAER